MVINQRFHFIKNVKIIVTQWMNHLRNQSDFTQKEYPSGSSRVNKTPFPLPLSSLLLLLFLLLFTLLLSLFSLKIEAHFSCPHSPLWSPTCLLSKWPTFLFSFPVPERLTLFFLPPSSFITEGQYVKASWHPQASARVGRPW